MTVKVRFKKDKYFRERGGTAKIIRVACAKCNANLLTYQKDGPGWLKRCYLNRIVEPSVLADEGAIKNLVCVCGVLIGTPMRHKDGRLAYHLIRGVFKRRATKLVLS